jgi:hypothetical protein
MSDFANDQSIRKLGQKDIAYYKSVIYPLDILVQLVNTSPGAKMEVTITVNGIVISGIPISVMEYHEGMANNMSNAHQRSKDTEEKRGI